MKGLIQRVSRASVEVDGELVGAIERGLLLLLGVEREDTEQSIDRLLHKLTYYRIFPDSEGKMNLSVREIEGAVLVVSQFTLAADTRKGLRPGFSTAASPELAERLYDHFVEKLKATGVETATGIFGADMQVSLVNDGPVTFMLEA